MDELVAAITKKTGISEAQATQAAEVAVDFLKSKLPEGLAGQVDGLLSGEGGGGAAGLMGKLGGLMGG